MYYCIPLFMLLAITVNFSIFGADAESNRFPERQEIVDAGETKKIKGSPSVDKIRDSMLQFMLEDDIENFVICCQENKKYINTTFGEGKKYTPLGFAIAHNSPELVKTVLSFGACVNAPVDASGALPYALHQNLVPMNLTWWMSNYHEITKLLQDAQQSKK